MFRSFILALSIATGALASPALAGEYDTIKAEAGQALFDKECHRCHSVDADRASYGPLLTGVVGREAGTFPDYPYSEALTQAHFVWTPGALKAWMEDNDALLPGTKMRHVGIDDPTVQDFIVTYLETLGG
ncbi:cytochrome c family protein [Maritimibacter sp. DP1N21-5]|uniref:c-type cytochrome n=1 Tax=Maritimibacter sp. DP1N21-5 TaxID=2836867 RepID=UPI001C480362|nr:c-type cytochrome [Maritimibacter sp. DP1N21-5]MBV7409222.1 c-type cytochrome [Maritimibacter sp. DP1N21-5]